jgi:hypothetical protein
MRGEIPAISEISARGELALTRTLTDALSA